METIYKVTSNEIGRLVLDGLIREGKIPAGTYDIKLVADRWASSKFSLEVWPCGAAK